jgi:ubiquinone/menaquinone biosynthesis C-methylase UbiE
MYLELNPAVADAVRSGDFPSGWHHYLMYGWREARPGVAPEVNRRLGSIFSLLGKNAAKPFPPPHLRKRVHGVEELSSFDLVGMLASCNIYEAIESASIELGRGSRILDFGCGCGRIIRYFSGLYDKSKFYGTDIDKEAISWCSDQLPHLAEFITNEERPPLPFAAEFFDFVYSISIFTHLPEDMQFAWLEELRRVTKKDGFLLITVHGRELFQPSSRREKKQFEKAGFYYSVATGTEGLPEFYQTSFHTEEYIARHWSKFFEIKKIIKKGIVDFQDIVLCKRIR